MQRRRFYVGPHWPAKLSDYEHLRAVGDPDWAWEFLRRNPSYQRDHRMSRLASEKPIRHARGLLLTRTRRRCRRAEAWDLYCFRRSAFARSESAGNMAADSPTAGVASACR